VDNTNTAEEWARRPLGFHEQLWTLHIAGFLSGIKRAQAWTGAFALRLEVRMNQIDTTTPLALRLPEAAKIVGLSQRCLWQLAKDGEVPCIRLGSGPRQTLLFRREALSEWLRSREDQAA